jgi:hypothetical protein
MLIMEIPSAAADMQTDDGRRRAHRHRVILWAILLFALVCHLRQYAANRSYWHDEASLVLNIRGKPAAQLVLGKLDYEQAAPPLFLLLERGLYRTLGGSELSLRSLPFACGILSIFLMAAIARTVARPPWDLLAILLFGTSDMMVWHATEAKPYGTDVFVALLLLALAMRCLPPHALGRQGAANLRRFLILGGFATVAAWFSYPATLVFAGLSLTLLPALARAGRRGWIAWLACNAAVGISFLLLLLIVVRKQHDANLASVWEDDFLDLRHPLHWPAWLFSRLLGLSNYPLAVGGPVILIGAILGAYALVRTRRLQLLGFLTGPLLAALAAAAVHRYPFDGARLTAFLVPSVVLLAVLGLEFIVQTGWRRLGYFTWIPAGFLAGLSIFWAAIHLAVPHTRSNLRPVAAFVAQHVQPDDGIYALDERVWICYWPADDRRLRPELDRADQIPFKRFWVIWSFSSDRNLHRLDPRLHWLATFADRRDKFIDNAGGEAFLFERRPGELPAQLEPPNIDTAHKIIRPVKAWNPPGGNSVE